MRIIDWSSDVCSSDLRGRGIERQRAARHHLRIVPALPLGITDRHHMVGEDAPESRVRNRRRAYIVRRRIGVRQVGEGGSGHAKTPLLCWFQERASCQRAARRATVATMPDENFLSQVPARSEERRVGKGCGRTCRSGWEPENKKKK